MPAKFFIGSSEIASPNVIKKHEISIQKDNVGTLK
jgi:hypothetical protein